MSKMFANRNIKLLQKLSIVHTSDITCLEFWGDSLLFSGSSDKTVRVFKWQSGKGFTEETYSPLLGHKYGVTSLSVSPQGGVLASASVDGTICLWDIKNNGNLLNILNQEAGESIRACTFSPNNEYIISSDDTGTVCIWDQNKSFIKSFKCHEESVHSIAFSRDTKILITGCTVGNLRIILTNNFIKDENVTPSCSIDAAHDLGVLSVAFNTLIQNDPSDCNTSIYTIATCGTDHLIKIWKIYYLENYKNGSNNNSRLVPQTPQEHFSGTSTIHCTECMNAECVVTIDSHGSSVTCVRFNIAGSLLASCSMDKIVKLWDLNGTCIKILAEHTRYVNCLAINTNSTLLASGSNDRSIIIWDLSDYYTMDSFLPGMRSFLFKWASIQYETPMEFFCPITHELMKDPVTLLDGFTYESTAINDWFNTGKCTSPMTNMILTDIIPIPNTILKEKIDKYLFD